MSAREVVTGLGAYTLRSGRRLVFERVEHLETEAVCFHVVSENKDGRRYVVRIPQTAMAALQQAILAFKGERAAYGADLENTNE